MVCVEAPWRFCQANRDCPRGLCAVGPPRQCFLDTIARIGAPDVPLDGHAEPTLVGTSCLPATGAVAANVTAGLPGPAAFTLPVSVDFRP
jgi:hypothetical protein